MKSTITVKDIELLKLDKDKTYICKVKLPKDIPLDMVEKMMDGISSVFKTKNVENIIFIPEGDERFAKLDFLGIQEVKN
jgi:hypothetical protein